MVILLRGRGFPTPPVNIASVVAAAEIFSGRVDFSGHFRRLLIPHLPFFLRPPFHATRLVCGTARMDADQFSFGPYKIDPSEVFYSTILSYAMVNLRPVLPGVW
ncbi:hypothetical protein HPP92_014952 [Vanilla planifolia]|uniref:Uncharacterized protein n=1 Tax=Vanilla planifolia TaxID=51239 RepID=A0A835QKZ3_VANPL|nr:hypothetical protein HPP92_014952 [Vanilla planifolia]